jgi:hypothetical protein
VSSAVKLVIDEAEYDLDLTRFMLSEAIALEDEWGLSTDQFAAAVTSGRPPLRVVGAMVWLVKVRHIAAADGISFREAAAKLPVATFDTNLTALRIENGAEQAGPTPGGTRTRTTRTTRATSAKPRTKNA